MSPVQIELAENHAYATSSTGCYVSYTAGKYINTREGGYEGFSRNITGGVDFIFSETLMFGAGLGYEYSELEFDNALDGSTTKNGWRLDAYGASKPSDLFSIEGLVSYSWLDNSISAASETGDFTSNRFYGFGKVNGHFDVEPYQISPYVSFDYLTETTDSYTTNFGTAIGSVRTEAIATAGGIRVSTNDSLILGLSSFATYEFKYHWTGTEAATLNSGDVVDPSDCSSTFAFGLSGPMNDVFGVDWLDGATLDLSVQAVNPLARERSYSATGGLRWRF